MMHVFKPKSWYFIRTFEETKNKKRVTIVENFCDKYFNPLSSSMFINELKSHPIVKCNYYLNDYLGKNL